MYTAKTMMYTAKTISIEDLEFLEELCKKMNEQDNRGTAAPIGYVIRQKLRRPCWEHQADGWLIHDTECPESLWYDTDTMKELKEFFGKTKIPWSKIRSKQAIFDWLRWDAPKEIKERFNIVPYQNYEDFGYNVFLTEDAIKEHLRLNYYHYKNYDTYGIHFWRNPEMKRLIEILFRLTQIEDKRNK